MESQAVIIFDGSCAFCNSSVRFDINHDPEGIFLFSPLGSASGQQLIAEYGIEIENLDSIILLEGGNYFTRGEAALNISKHLTGIWAFAHYLKIFPLPFRDWCYDLIARHRHKIFGQDEYCSLPNEGDYERILD